MDKTALDNLSRIASDVQNGVRSSTGPSNDAIDLAMGDILSEVTRLRDTRITEIPGEDGWTEITWGPGFANISPEDRLVVPFGDSYVFILDGDNTRVELADRTVWKYTSLEDETVDPKVETDEFMLLLSNGSRFYTSGWDDIRSLLLAMPEHFDPERTVAGSVEPHGTQYETAIARTDVKLVQDLRSAGRV